MLVLSCRGSFDLVLQFIYTGQNSVTSENVATITEAASVFQIHALVEKCEENLFNNISIETCLDIWRLASVHSSRKVIDKAFKLILSHFEDFVKRDEFTSLSTQELFQVLSDDMSDITWIFDQVRFKPACSATEAS